jgi:hypothetical protein
MDGARLSWSPSRPLEFIETQRICAVLRSRTKIWLAPLLQRSLSRLVAEERNATNWPVAEVAGSLEGPLLGIFLRPSRDESRGRRKNRGAGQNESKNDQCYLAIHVLSP